MAAISGAHFDSSYWRALRELRAEPPSVDLAVALVNDILREFGPLGVKVVRVVPGWKPGDVVILRFHGPTSQPYTYVRGVRDWPGDTTRMSDADMTRQYLAGQATPVLQQGGNQFDKARLEAVQ